MKIQLIKNVNNTFRILLAKSVVVFVLLAAHIATSSAQVRYTNQFFASRSEVLAQNGIAATSHPLATQTALDVLKKGGSAVDAAIAANAMLGLVEPTGNGIGGDIYAIVWDAKAQKLFGLNGSGRSPKKMSYQFLKEKNFTTIPSYGALSVSVPGCVDGWFQLHQRFGKLSMKDLLSPTIQYAENGFPVTEVISFLWKGYAETLKGYEGFRKLYMPNGKAPDKGQIFKNPELAATLRSISEKGRDAFYKGNIALSIANTVQKEGGFLSIEDLSTHQSEWVTPVSTKYRGYDIWQLPPNSQGLAVLQMMNLLERYDISKMGFASPDYMHLFIESKKLVFEDRAAYYADGVDSGITSYLAGKKYAEIRSQLIDINKAADQLLPGYIPPFGNTIYLTVADKDGNMVSLIQSNFAGMGSGIVPEGSGFSLQNRGCSFTLEPNKPNTYLPGKRPFHTLIPGFVTKDEKPYLSFGVMGADMQPLGQVQILVNMIDFGMNLQEASDAPRINHVGSTGPDGTPRKGKGTVYLEAGFPSSVITTLQKKGHVIGYDLRGYGGFQGILYDAKNKIYIGASEFRKDGYAAGY
jgi:gamma-glutamyltranspeptidase/glutathione hydrolase